MKPDREHPASRRLRALRPAALLATVGFAVLALWATGVATATVASASPSAPHIPCRPGGRGTVTIAHSAHARIFADENGYDYACLYRNGHARLLSLSEHFEDVLVRFSGDYVGFVLLEQGANAYIGVMNLNTGRFRKFHPREEVKPIKAPPGECPDGKPDCSIVCPRVDSLVLAPDGALAWIAVNFPATGIGCGTEVAPVKEVRADDRRGLRTMAAGSGIEARSLRLSGKLLSFTEEGRLVTTTL